MRVFVTGVNGQLGHDVINELDKRNISCIGSDITENYSGETDMIQTEKYGHYHATNEGEFSITQRLYM